VHLNAERPFDVRDRCCGSAGYLPRDR